MLDCLADNKPEILDTCEYFLGYRDYGFERHTIQGKEKMELFIEVPFLVGLAMAKAKIEKRNKKHLASLVS